MTDLIRTKQGKFNIEEAYTVSDIRNGNYNLKEEADALDIKELNIDQELYKKIDNGLPFEKEYQKEYILFIYNNEKIAIYKYNGIEYRMYLKLNV